MASSALLPSIGAIHLYREPGLGVQLGRAALQLCDPPPQLMVQALKVALRF